MTRQMILLSICLSLVVVTGCSNSELDERDDATFGQTHPIINGQPANAAHHAAVVSLHSRSGNSVDPSIFCSGTLIASSVVLTAGHCVTAGFSSTISPSGLAIYVGDSPETDSQASFFPVSEIALHPDYSSLPSNDIALVRLSVAVRGVAPVTPLPQAKGFTNSDVGSLNLNFAGFGVNEFGRSGTRLQTNGTLGGLGCSVSGCQGTPSNFERATQISYTQFSTAVCSGDSGGPAFVNRGGVIYVGGITSYGDQRCTRYGASTRVDAYQTFIQNFIGDNNNNPPPSSRNHQVLEAANLSSAVDQESRFNVELPSDATNVVVSMQGGTGDADLYTRFGSPPTTSTYDCRPFRNGNVETCDLDSPGSSTLHIMINAYTAFSNVTLRVEYDGSAPQSGGGADDELPVDVNIGSLAKNEEIRRSYNVPAGAKQVEFSISGTTGDADLYVRFGNEPTLTDYDCRPYLESSQEVCTFSNPTPGVYHVLIVGFSAATNLQFVGSLQ